MTLQISCHGLQENCKVLFLRESELCEDSGGGPLDKFGGGTERAIGAVDEPQYGEGCVR